MSCISHHSPTHSLTHTHALTHTHTHSLTQFFIPQTTLIHNITNSLTHSPTHSLTHTRFYTTNNPITHTSLLTPLLSHSLTHTQLQAGLEVNEAMDRQQRIDQLRTSGNTTSFRMSKPRAQRRPPVGGKWTSSEDTKLKGIVAEHGPKNWKKIADILGDTRTDVQCLHRWNKVSE
jgi:hypothetical protein